jgi:predicted small lipoprotein YifL
MRTAASLTLTALALVTLAACGGPTPHEPRTTADKEEARAKGRDTDETVFDDMIQTQDRARAVEGLTLGRKGEMDEAIRRSEDDAPSDER